MEINRSSAASHVIAINLSIEATYSGGPSLQNPYVGAAASRPSPLRDVRKTHVVVVQSHRDYSVLLILVVSSRLPATASEMMEVPVHA